MKITKRSQVSGIEHTIDLDITDKQWKLWNSLNRPHIQYVFPNLKKEEREFILTGTTAEEWNALFPPEDDEVKTMAPPDTFVTDEDEDEVHVGYLIEITTDEFEDPERDWDLQDKFEYDNMKHLKMQDDVEGQTTLESLTDEERAEINRMREELHKNHRP